MIRNIRNIFTALLVIAALLSLPPNALAALADIELPNGTIPETVTITGTATENTMVSIKITDSDNKIVYFNGMKAGAEGIYSFNADLRDNTLPLDVTVTCQSTVETAQIKALGTTYTVTFDSRSGSTVNPLTGVSVGAKIVKPDDPSRLGYTFDGWYTDSEYTVGWDFDNDTVTKDLTLFAKWIEDVDPSTYLVTFDSQGGSTVDPQTVVHDGFAIRPADPVKLGYTFAGWYYEDSDLPFNFGETIISSDITLTAKWTTVEYTISILPDTIVQKHLSYIHVKYSDNLQDAFFAMLDQSGNVIGSPVQGANGKAIITVTAPDKAGTYDVVALLDGNQCAQETIEVMEYNDNIWVAYTDVNKEGFVVIKFNEGITTKENKLMVNENYATGYIGEDGRSIVTSIQYESLETGVSTFSVSGVKYPRLYPSYTFTFTATVTKQ